MNTAPSPRSLAPLRQAAAALLTILLMTSCGSDDGTAPAAAVVPDDAASATAVVKAAWVEYNAHNQAVARAITSYTTQCPQLVVDGVTSRMTVRVGAATVPQRATASLASLSKPSDFPVAVCESTIPVGAAKVTVGTRALPVPKSNPQRIVVIGDTGCRLKQSSNAYQSCNDATQWPLTTVAAAAAAMKPDLVLHVGDYHYRENPCPADITGCSGSPWGYGWDTWNARPLHARRGVDGGRAVDRRARQPRVVQSCGPGLVPLPRPVAVRRRPVVRRRRQRRVRPTTRTRMRSRSAPASRSSSSTRRTPAASRCRRRTRSSSSTSNSSSA